MNKVVKLVLLVLLLPFSCQDWDTDLHRYRIGSYDSGLWFDEQRPGHGLKIEVLDDDRMLIYWYMYQLDGEPAWLISVADILGDTATGEAYLHEGMEFGVFDPATRSDSVWGTLSFQVLDCNHALLNYEISAWDITWFTGEIELSRLTMMRGQKCPILLEPGSYGNYTATVGPAPAAADLDASYVTVQKNGDMAYQVISSGFQEYGYGRVFINDQGAFEYEVDSDNTSWHGVNRGVKRGPIVLEEDRITLDLGERGVFEGTLRSAFHNTVTLNDLEGTWYERDRGGQWQYEVFSWGEVSGSSGRCYSLGIPDPGVNQVVLKHPVNCNPESGFPPESVALGEYDPDTGSLIFIEDDGIDFRVREWSREEPAVSD